MSAMWSFWDWMSFLDLFETPYPNGPFSDTRNPEELFTKIDQVKTKKELVYWLRHFVYYHVGDQDADTGRSIAKHIRYIIRERGWNKVKNNPDQDNTEKVFDNLRVQIYGNCTGAGLDWNNFQPCPPDNWYTYTDINNFERAYAKASKGRGDKWAEQFQACRNKLADAKNKNTDRWKYTVLLMAERLDVDPGLLAGGLKKEF